MFILNNLQNLLFFVALFVLFTAVHACPGTGLAEGLKTERHSTELQRSSSHRHQYCNMERLSPQICGCDGELQKDTACCQQADTVSHVEATYRATESR